MQRALLIVIGASAAVGLAGGAGIRLVAPDGQSAPASEAASEAVESRPTAASGHASKSPAKAQKKKSGGKVDPAAYFKFSRQFVTPLLEEGEPAALLILDVVIELAPDASEAIYADEPRLRDAVLKALVAQAAKGDLREALTAPDRLELTRAAVLEGVRAIIGDDARAVLLMDVGYQPF